MDIRPSAYVAGEWRTSDDTVEITDSTQEQPFARVALASVEDAGDAVLAARAAFGAWSSTSTAERRELLGALADGLAARAEDIARVASAEVGSTITFSRRVQAGLPVSVLRTTIEAIDEVDAEERIGHSVVKGLPVGVVSAITPWNYPLY
jgi:aldehyde dehydrogenase (NAD+)